MIISSHLEKLQKYHQPQGQTNHCGPFAVATILPLFGIQGLSGEYLAAHFNRLGSSLKRIIPARIPNYATFPWGIVNVFKHYHINARWEIFCRRDTLLSRINTNNIQIVLVGELLKRRTHYLILTGFDDKLGMGFVDPAYPNPSIHWIPEKIFITQWSRLWRNCILIESPDP